MSVWTETIQVDKNNYINSVLSNVAHFLDVGLNTPEIDPAYNLRVDDNFNTKMIWLSNPLSHVPVYPVVILNITNISGIQLGENDTTKAIPIQLTVAGKQTEQFELNNIVTQINKILIDNRTNLNELNVNFKGDSLPSNFRTFVKDSDNPFLVFAVLEFDCYTII